MQNSSYNDSTPKRVGVIAIVMVSSTVFVIQPLLVDDSQMVVADLNQESDERQIALSEEVTDAGSLEDEAPIREEDILSNLEVENSSVEPLEDEAEEPELIRTASIDYAVPRRHINGITVSVTLNEGVVEAVEAEHEFLENTLSEVYIAEFDAGFEESIIGKALVEIAEENINGASLTSAAFFDAIRQL